MLSTFVARLHISANSKQPAFALSALFLLATGKWKRERIHVSTCMLLVIMSNQQKVIH